MPVRARASFFRQAGTYDIFLARMLESLSSRKIPDGDYAGAQPLARISLQPTSNFVVALVKAWAKVADILSFYQARHLEESYLLTATEDRSIVELAGEIGYAASPGVAANVCLAFTVSENPGLPHAVEVPAGTRVQSIPDPGGQPQVFETLTTQTVRGEWNSHPAAPLPVERDIIPAGLAAEAPLVEAHVAGTQTGFDPGDIAVLLDAPLTAAVHASGAPVDEQHIALLLQVIPLIHSNLTRLVWKWPGSLAGTVSITAFSVAAFRQQARLFGYQAPPWDSLPDAVKVANGGTVGGGLLYASLDLKTWSPVNAGLPLVKKGTPPANALLGAADGTLYAATASGVYRRDPGAAEFQPATGSIGATPVYAVTEGPDGSLFAGCDGAVFRSVNRGAAWDRLSGTVSVQLVKEDGKETWISVSTELPAGSVRSLAVDAHGLVYAATDRGLFANEMRGGGWLPQLPGATVHAVAATPDRRYVLAAASTGILRLEAGGKDWKAANAGLPAGAGVALLHAGSAGLFAAAGNAVCESRDNGSSWQSAGPALAASVVALSASSVGIIAATATAAYRWDISSKSWTELAPGSLTGVAALAASGTAVYAVIPSAGIIETEWPPMTIAPDHIDLDQPYSRLIPGSYVLLRQAGLTMMFQVQKVETVHRHDFWLSDDVTRLTLVAGDARFSQFSIREASVLMESDILPQALEPPAQLSAKPQMVIETKPWKTALLPGQLVMILGKEARAAAAPPPATHLTPSGSNTQITVSVPGEHRPSLSWLASVNSIKTKKTPSFLATSRLAPACDDTMSLSVHTSHDGFDIDPTSIEVRANIVWATQGETVAREVLGSGDASRANQRFRLKKCPLIYVQPPGQARPFSTLTISVNGVAWREVPSFDGAMPASEVYIVRLDHQRCATIIFGDGYEGARLPTGTDNITASYRVGDPAQGAVRPDALTNIRGRQLGLRLATNPQPARVPRMPETGAEVAARAPLTVDSLDRLVSLTDYQSYASQIDSVAQAHAWLEFAGRRPRVMLAVAFATAPASDAEAKRLCAELAARLRSIEAVPALREVRQAETITFAVSATIYPAPGASVETLCDAVAAALTQAFAPAARAIGQAVSSSEVVAAIQSVPGVAGTALTGLEAFLPAAPYQLLVIAEKPQVTAGSIL